MRLLDGHDVARLLDMESCIRAVDEAFRARGTGRHSPSAVLGLELGDGSLHAKLAGLELSRPYVVAKINANFPGNPAQRGLPTIQGVLVLFDGSSGVPLAVMDSASITTMRTAATSAVAATYLAGPDASTVTFIGCGVQARAHLTALCHVRPIDRVIAFDIDAVAAERFATEAGAKEHVAIAVESDLRRAARASEIVVTSTPSRRALLALDDVAVGTFIAAVGADNEHKQEIAPQLLQAAVIVVDDLDQCARIGDLHHALAAGLVELRDVRASLDQVVAGVTPGRRSDREIIVFDSTGVAIEDLAAASLVYERAEELNAGHLIALGVS